MSLQIGRLHQEKSHFSETQLSVNCRLIETLFILSVSII